MQADFLSKIVRPSVYQLKQGTSTSYQFVAGNQILPKTISLIRCTEACKVSRSGRGLIPKVGQMKAQFTLPERSPYKQHKPFKVQTSIWPAAGYQTVFYGTIGITGEAGTIDSDNGDLILFQTADWQQVNVFLFVGLADPARLPENLSGAVEYIRHL